MTTYHRNADYRKFTQKISSLKYSKPSNLRKSAIICVLIKRSFNEDTVLKGIIL